MSGRGMMGGGGREALEVPDLLYAGGEKVGSHTAVVESHGLEAVRVVGKTESASYRDN